MKKGFTLLEILIVVAITALIGGMISIKFLRVNQTTAVEDSVLTLSAYFKDARSKTVSGQTSGTASSWGIYIDAATFTHPVLFVDTDQDGAFSAGDTTEDIFLDENTEIVECFINSTLVPDCGVLFSAPSGEATIFTLGGSPVAPFTSVQLDIQSTTDTLIQESVTVTAPSGLVITSLAI